MIYVFNRDEKLQAILSNEDKHSCPYWNAPVKEVLGAEFTFSFTVPYDHPDAAYLEELGYVAILDYERNFQLFVITQIEEKHSIELLKEVFCEHASVELGDDFIENLLIDRKEVSTALPTLLTGTRWTAGTMENTTIHDLTVTYKSVREALANFSERWGVELRFRVTLGGSGITGRYVDAVKARGALTGKRFVYGKDLKEVVRTIEAESVKTALYGYGKEIDNADGTKERISFNDVAWSTAGGDPVDKPTGQRYVGHEGARATYGKLLSSGLKGHRFGVYINDAIEDPVELLNATYSALLPLITPRIQYKMKVIDLMKMLGLEGEAVHLGDTVYTIDADLNLRLEARVIEYEYDITVPEESEITLGNFRPKFTDQFEEIESLVYTAVANAPTSEIPEDVLREGDVIDVSWLQGAIDTAQNKVLAGNGTVTVTQNDGILIVDDPLNPQKALRLLAGTLALANQRDSTTGLFNWRTFGTGEGFLADLVETGYIRFDRAKGGILTLGGEIVGYNADGTPIYQDGELHVVDALGEVITSLTGENKGFDKLSIGELTGSGNIVTFNHLGEYVLYVDPVSGNDEADGLSTSSPLKTIQAAIDRIPKYNNERIWIRITRTDITWIETVEIRGIFGSGRIGIELGRRNTLKGEIYVRHCYNEVNISTAGSAVSTANTSSERAEIINQNATGWSAPVFCFYSNFVYIYDLIVNANNLSEYAIYNYGCHWNRLVYCELYNAKYSCYVAAYGGQAEITNCSGLAPRGIYSTTTAHVGGSGRAPAGSTSNVVTGQGGFANGTWTHDMGAATPVYAPVATTTWTPNDYGSVYNGTNWTLQTTYVYHGQRSGEYPWYGYLHFNTSNFGALKNSDGTNRPISKVRLLLQRYNGYGDNTSRKPKLHYSSTSPTSGSIPTLYGGAWSDVGYLWGESKWITLPTTFGTAFQNGSAKSIWLYNGADQSNYMRFEPKATLEITHG